MCVPRVITIHVLKWWCFLMRLVAFFPPQKSKIRASYRMMSWKVVWKTDSYNKMSINLAMFQYWLICVLFFLPSFYYRDINDHFTGNMIQQRSIGSCSPSQSSQQWSEDTSAAAIDASKVSTA